MAPHLLTLPAEILQTIYEYVFDGLSIEVAIGTRASNRVRDVQQRQTSTGGLLLTCWQFRAGALPVFHKHIKAVISNARLKKKRAARLLTPGSRSYEQLRRYGANIVLNGQHSCVWSDDDKTLILPELAGFDLGAIPIVRSLKMQVSYDTMWVGPSINNGKWRLLEGDDGADWLRCHWMSLPTLCFGLQPRIKEVVVRYSGKDRKNYDVVVSLRYHPAQRGVRTNCV